MFGTSDLHRVNRYQDELRRDAASHRLVAKAKGSKQRPERTRRVLGLRFSFA